MTDFDISTTFASALDVLQEVAHVAGGSEKPFGIRAQRFADHLRITSLQRAPADEDPAILAFKVNAILAIRHAMNRHAVGILKDYLKVPMAVVAILDALLLAFEGGDFDRAAVIHAECPLSHIIMVSAPVGHLAAGISVPPAELVMATLLNKGYIRGLALPKVPVEAFGRRFSLERAACIGVADACFDLLDLADAAILHEFAGKTELTQLRSLLAACLEDTIISASGAFAIALPSAMVRDSGFSQ